MFQWQKSTEMFHNILAKVPKHKVNTARGKAALKSLAKPKISHAFSNI